MQTLEVYDPLVAELEAVLEYRRAVVEVRTQLLHHVGDQLAKLPTELRDQLPVTGKLESRLRKLETVDAANVSTRAGVYRVSWLIQLVDQDRQARRQIHALQRRISELLDEHGTTLRDEPGVGPIIAATLICEVGDAFRFSRESKFGRWSGTGAVALSSGEGNNTPVRHRLDIGIGGNPRVNSMPYIISITQQRDHPAARSHLERKAAEGKTRREARRAHKRHLANRVIRRMWHDEQARRSPARGGGLTRERLTHPRVVADDLDHRLNALDLGRGGAGSKVTISSSSQLRLADMGTGGCGRVRMDRRVRYRRHMAARGAVPRSSPVKEPAMPRRVAAAQFASGPGTIEANLDQALAAVVEAANREARLIVLPECCLSGYDLEWFRAGAPGGGEVLGGDGFESLVDLSRQRDIAIVVNDLERAGGALYSVSVVIDRGSELTRHRKTHLTHAEEAAGLTAGNELATPVELPGLGLAVSPLICFEHGFPEIALRLALDGAGLLAMSSAIRRGFEYLRDLRIRARAQDNGCYAVAANAVGRGFCGASFIADPHGEVIAAGSADDAEVIVAAIDPHLVEAARGAEPVLRRRRPDLYAPDAGKQ